VRSTTATSETRLFPPRSSGWLARPALERRLDEAFAKRLTTLTADAGFGKTTLLAEWASDVECGWYTVTAHTTDLSSFASGVARAIQSRVPELVLAAVPAGLSSGTEHDELLHADAFAGFLCDALDDCLSHDVVLVLDDVHELASPASARFLESLCRQAPTTLHLVLASRADPPFAVDRLRGQGQVLELSGADLAFDPAEIEALLGAKLGTEDAELAVALHHLTGGWPALVRLAVATLAAVPLAARAEAFEQLRGGGDAMFAYLAREVFERESPNVRQLLRTAALLDRFTPELCEALGVERAEEELAGLARRGFFLQRQDEYFSLHALIRDFALRTWPWPPEEAHALLRRAADWLESQGQVEDALSTLAAAKADRDLARLLAKHGGRLLAAGRTETVTRLAESVPVPLRDTAIEQLAGEAYTAQGQHDRALECFGRAVRDGEPIPSPLAWRMVQAHYFRDDLDEALAIYDRSDRERGAGADDALLFAWTASVRKRRGDVDEARALAAQALQVAETSGDDRALAAAHTAAAMGAPVDGDLLERDLHLTRALDAAQRAGDLLQVVRVRNNRASNLLEQGLVREAIEELDDAIAHAELVGFAGLRALALMNRGLAYWCLGRLEEASADYEAAISVYRQTGTREISYAIIGRGDVHRERGNLAMARAAYEEGLQLAERSGDVQGLVPGLYQLAKVLVDEEPDTARRLADRAVSYGWPDLPWALNAAGWVALAHGDRQRASELAAAASTTAREQRDRFGLAESLELTALCAPDPAEEAPLLEEALAIWRELGNQLHEAAVELALARRSSGPAAQSAAERAERRLRTLGVRVSPSGPAALLRFVAPQTGAAVNVETMGGFRVRRNGTPIRHEEWRSKKARDLLKILLARRGRPTPREYVMDALWPEEDPVKVRNRLSVALSTLRAVLDPEKRFDPDHFVRTDRDCVSLDLDHLVVDVEIFVHEAQAGLALRASAGLDEATERLEYAESLYAGDFLEEDPYEDWAVALREQARAAYIASTRALAEAAAEAGQHGAAVSYLLRVLERDAYDEHAHLALVSALAAAGRHGDARRAYRRYAGRMAEISVEPASFPVPAPRPPA
jgi:ATP/maltotriose-dependent transcriptional regulator MalT/DNA-binding SARP family transcriptional activator